MTDLDSHRESAPGQSASESLDAPHSTHSSSQDEADAPEPLIVEERLRLALVSLDCLKRMTRLTAEPTGIPLLSDIKPFARFAREVAVAVEGHLRAIKDALPPHATDLVAPAGRGCA